MIPTKPKLRVAAKLAWSSEHVCMDEAVMMRACYAGRVSTVERKVTVWCLSFPPFICVVCFLTLLQLQRGQRMLWPITQGQTRLQFLPTP